MRRDRGVHQSCLSRILFPGLLFVLFVSSTCIVAGQSADTNTDLPPDSVASVSYTHPNYQQFRHTTDGGGERLPDILADSAEEEEWHPPPLSVPQTMLPPDEAAEEVETDEDDPATPFEPTDESAPSTPTDSEPVDSPAGVDETDPEETHTVEEPIEQTPPVDTSDPTESTDPVDSTIPPADVDEPTESTGPSDAELQPADPFEETPTDSPTDPIDDIDPMQPPVTDETDTDTNTQLPPAVPPSDPTPPSDSEPVTTDPTDATNGGDGGDSEEEIITPSDPTTSEPTPTDPTPDEEAETPSNPSTTPTVPEEEMPSDPTMSEPTPTDTAPTVPDEDVETPLEPTPPVPSEPTDTDTESDSSAEPTDSSEPIESDPVAPSDPVVDPSESTPPDSNIDPAESESDTDSPSESPSPLDDSDATADEPKPEASGGALPGESTTIEAEPMPPELDLLGPVIPSTDSESTDGAESSASESASSSSHSSHSSVSLSRSRLARPDPLDLLGGLFNATIAAASTGSDSSSSEVTATATATAANVTDLLRDFINQIGANFTQLVAEMQATIDNATATEPAANATEPTTTEEPTVVDPTNSTDTDLDPTNSTAPGDSGTVDGETSLPVGANLTFVHPDSEVIAAEIFGPHLSLINMSMGVFDEMMMQQIAATVAAAAAANANATETQVNATSTDAEPEIVVVPVEGSDADDDDDDDDSYDTASRSGSIDRTGWPKGCLDCRYDPDVGHSFDGSCNNEWSPTYGMVGSSYLRLMAPEFPDGTGATMPSTPINSRLLSNILMSQAGADLARVDTRGLSNWIVEFGQLFNHERHLNTNSAGVNHPAEQADIPLPSDRADPGGFTRPITFFRAEYKDGTGTSHRNPRESVNLGSTAWIDGSPIYGGTAAIAQLLRGTATDGELQSQLIGAEGEFPPNQETLPVPGSLVFDPKNTLAFGEPRANEQLGLSLVQLIWFREHNRLARQYKAAYPHLTSDQLFARARRMLIGLMQKCTIDYFHALGVEPEEYPGYYGRDPSAYVEFVSAAFRSGHSQISDFLKRFDSNGQECCGGHLQMVDGFFAAPQLWSHAGSVESLIRGFTHTPTMAVDAFSVEGVRNLLFGRGAGLDLLAIDAERTYDIGIPSHRKVRRALGLKKIKKIEELGCDQEVAARVRSAYANVGLYKDKDILSALDLFTGGLLESPVRGSSLGATFLSIYTITLRQIRSSDRYWFERTGALSSNRRLDAQMRDEIMETDFGDILARNSRLARSSLPKNVFFYAPLVDTRPTTPDPDTDTDPESPVPTDPTDTPTTPTTPEDPEPTTPEEPTTPTTPDPEEPTTTPETPTTPTTPEEPTTPTTPEEPTEESPSEEPVTVPETPIETTPSEEPTTGGGTDTPVDEQPSEGPTSPSEEPSPDPEPPVTDTPPADPPADSSASSDILPPDSVADPATDSSVSPSDSSHHEASDDDHEKEDEDAEVA